jgi:predicted O-methyltransferase YrrM
MNLKQFRYSFEQYFPPSQHDFISTHFEDKFTRSFYDPCFDVEGMTSIKKQYLLKIAYACLEFDECYLEIGTYQGKSLISAIKNGSTNPVYACDDFSQFTETNSLSVLIANLQKHNLREKVRIFDSDFRKILSKINITEPVGAYFFDGGHDFDSQYDGIRLIEPLLAPTALVIVDDWRFESDSQSYAKEATIRAINESRRSWNLLYELPARFNGDHAMWWNGVGVLSTTT